MNLFARTVPSASAFPERKAGRLLRYPFRGLLSVHSRYGLHAHQVAIATFFTEGFSGFVTSTAASIVTGRNEPAPGRDFHPLWTSAFPRRTLVVGLLAERDQLLVIDSPEAHLHPRAQSRIGAFLACIAAAGVRVIVETHSEHILNGIRLAIKDRRLKPEEAAIHFFDPSGLSDKSIAHVTTLLVGDNGEISDWPTGFFDQSERDLASLAGWS